MTDPTIIRRLDRGDAESVDAFVTSGSPASALLMSGLKNGGFVNAGGPHQGIHFGAFTARRLVGLVSLSSDGSLLLQSPILVGELVVAASSFRDQKVTRIFGPWEQVTIAMNALGANSRPTSLVRKEISYALELDQLRVPKPLEETTTTCRPSEESDLGLLLDWRLAFLQEVLGAADTPATRSEEAALIRKAHQLGRLFVAEANHEPVAMSILRVRTPDCVLIASVYTPQALRSRKFSRCVVAGSLLLARATGVTKALLFTGVANNAAQRAYESLGFKQAGEEYGLVFSSPHS